MDNILRMVEFIRRSSDRLVNVVGKPRDRTWREFMKRESTLHLKRSIRLWWEVRRFKLPQPPPEPPPP